MKGSLLLPLFFFFFICFLLKSSASSFIPTPPRQNSAQQQVWNAAQEEAKNASALATPLLLSLFNSTEFRSSISMIPQLSNSSSADLLQILRNIVLGSVLAHNFPLTFSISTLDVNLRGMIESGFIPNYYTASVVEGLLNYSAQFADLENYAEVTFMGYPPFANLSSPTPEEALTRPGYTCVNIYNIAGGCNGFGNVSLVTNSTWLKNMTLLSAVDTGLYTSCCPNVTTNSPLTQLDTLLKNWEQMSKKHRNPFIRSHFTQLLQDLETNPSSSSPLLSDFTNEVGSGNASLCNSGFFILFCNWNTIPGTFEYFDHSILANLLSWNIPFSELFKRHYIPDYPLLDDAGTGFLASYIAYLEGDVSGSIPFPEGVAFMQIDASGTLGFPEITLAREWALNNSWPITWNCGIDFDSFNSTAEVFESVDINNMLLDPFCVRETTNLSISDSALQLSQTAFLELSNFTSTYLQENPDGGSPLFWAKAYSVLLTGVAPELILRYPSFGACGESCFAVQKSTGDCVCKLH